jgi:hypothetical protein
VGMIINASQSEDDNINATRVGMIINATQSEDDCGRYSSEG